MLEFLQSSIRLATPLVFAAMGGFLCERVGIATICLEGVMLVGAWTAAVLNLHYPWWVALIGGMLAGSLLILVHGWLTLKTRADQIVSGVAINLFASGITPLLTKILFGNTGNTPEIPGHFKLNSLTFPWLSEIPFIGPLLFDKPLIIYLAFALPFLLHFLAYRTGWGLRFLSSGDAPETLKSVGVSVAKIRYQALFLGGMLITLGGSYLAIGQSNAFTRDMTAGRGYIALTALIFGKWRPIPAFVACLFFGMTDAAQIRLQSSEVFGYTFPVQFIQALPYLVTLFVLVGFVGGAKPPLSIGKNIE